MIGSEERAAVDRVQMNSRELETLFARTNLTRRGIFVFTTEPGADGATVYSRMVGANGFEDPATGSACANLGGWHLARGQAPVSATLHQGEAVGRPSRLGLRVDADGGIYVTGAVIELGRGAVAVG